MMNKCKAIQFRYLPNAAHYSFCRQVSDSLETADETILNALGTLTVQFDDWLARETALMEWIRKSVLTEPIKNADGKMCKALVSFNAHVRAMKYNILPELAEAARRIYIVVKNYGKVYSKSYSEQEGDVRAILSLLNGAYRDDVTLLGLTQYVYELSALFTAFRQLLEQRDEAFINKPADKFPAVRAGVEAVYRQIVAIIDAGATLNVAPAFEAFINKLNPEIERINAEFRPVRYSISSACVDEIPPQPYTGSPATPVPVVYRVNAQGAAEKLTVGKDYNLTYRNHTKPGNASCTLHGKGKFNGRKTITFIVSGELRRENGERMESGK